VARRAEEARYRRKGPNKARISEVRSEWAEDGTSEARRAATSMHRSDTRAGRQTEESKVVSIDRSRQEPARRTGESEKSQREWMKRSAP